MGNELCSKNYCGYCYCDQTIQEEQYKTRVIKPREHTQTQSQTKYCTDLQQHVQIPKLLPTVLAVLESKDSLIQFTQKHSLFKTKSFGEDVYQGQFGLNGLPNGLGKMYKKDSSLFIGKFEQGKAEGQGLYILPDGAFFQGKLIDNKAECQKGKFCCEEYTYEGGFKDNLFHGQGTETSDRSIFEGSFVKGLKEVGELKWWAKSEPQKIFCYYGKFDEMGLFTDDGILTQPTGRYMGCFLKGKKHGEGVYVYKTNLKYQGEYKQGEKEGKGRISLVDKDLVIYEGNWRNGFPEGSGLKYDRKGKSRPTLFKDGIDLLSLMEPQKLN